MYSTILLILVLCGIGPALPAAAAVSVPTPTLAVASQAVLGGPARSQGKLILVLDGPDAASLAAPDMVKDVRDYDVAAPAPPIVQFGTPKQLSSAGPTQQRWLLPFAVEGMPENAELTRYVTMKIGEANWTLEYQLKSAAASWKVAPLPAQSRAISGTDAVPLNIAIEGQLPVQGLRLAQMEFIDQTTMQRLADGKLALCTGPDQCRNQPITLPAPGGTVWLAAELDRDGKRVSFAPGKYVGTLMLASHGKLETEVANLTIYVSDPAWKILGLLTIAAGVGCAFYFIKFLRERLSRSQLLLAPVRLRQSVDRLRIRLKALQAVAPAPEVLEKLDTVDAALSDDALEANGLPPVIPRPWGDVEGPGPEVYNAYVEGQAAWLRMLGSLIGDGLEVLVSMRSSQTDMSETQTRAFSAAWNSIDQAARVTGVQDATRTDATIKEAVAEFDKTLTKPAMPAPGMPGTTASSKAPPTKPAGTGQPRSPDLIRMRISADSRLGWWFIGTVTILGGAYLLIIDNFGFGTPRDFLVCLLWGAGLPATTIVASSTTSSIATSLSTAR